jgi:hypothetical protein
MVMSSHKIIMNVTIVTAPIKCIMKDISFAMNLANREVVLMVCVNDLFFKVLIK